MMLGINKFMKKTKLVNGTGNKMMKHLNRYLTDEPQSSRAVLTSEEKSLCM